MCPLPLEYVILCYLLHSGKEAENKATVAWVRDNW